MNNRKARYAEKHAVPPARSPRLMDQVRNTLRLKHYAYATERSYVHWILSYIRFHKLQHPRNLTEEHITKYLTYLAVNRHVSSSTQNQALNAVVFLYREVLKLERGDFSRFARARKERRVPTVLTGEEVTSIIQELRGTPRLMVELLFGTGMRLNELLRLRIKDIDFNRNQICIREAKGEKDRIVMLPATVKDRLREIIPKVQALHNFDLQGGFGAVFLPNALAKKYPNAEKEFRWQYIFPASKRSIDPRSGVVRRHHLFDSVLARYVKRAVERCGITKRVTCHTFRHSFATLILQQGADIRTLQTLLGHNDLKTTMIYTHVALSGPAGLRSPLDTLAIGQPVEKSSALPDEKITDAGSEGNKFIPKRKSISSTGEDTSALHYRAFAPLQNIYRTIRRFAFRLPRFWSSSSASRTAASSSERKSGPKVSKISSLTI